MAIPKFLLYRARNPGDPMRGHEIRCFADMLECPERNILVHDVISGRPPKRLLDRVDAVLVGGSGDYSVVKGGDWLPIARTSFVSCSKPVNRPLLLAGGFRRLPRHLESKVVSDLQRAELGKHSFELAPAGKAAPVFGPLGSPFRAQIGHQDIVNRLPDGAVLLCSSSRVVNEAFTFPGKPIYGTQFHPELEMEDLIDQVNAYPNYILKITGLPIGEFLATCSPAPDTPKLLKGLSGMCLTSASRTDV